MTAQNTFSRKEHERYMKSGELPARMQSPEQRAAAEKLEKRTNHRK